MQIRRVFNKRIRRGGKGTSVAGDVNAVISAHVADNPSTSHVTSRQRTRIVQRGGRTEVFEHEHTTDQGGADVPREDRQER